MSNIGFNEKTVHKLMDIIDSHKDKDIDDITDIELSNSIKFLFDKTGLHPKEDIVDPSNVTIRGLGMFPRVNTQRRNGVMLRRNAVFDRSSMRFENEPI